MEGTKGKQFRVRGTRREGEERERDLNSRTPLRKLFSFHESLSGVIIVLEKRESETLSTDSSPVCVAWWVGRRCHSVGTQNGVQILQLPQQKGRGRQREGDALRDSPIYRPIAVVQNPDKMIESFVHPRGKSQIGRVRWTESQNTVRIKSRWRDLVGNSMAHRCCSLTLHSMHPTTLPTVMRNDKPTQG